MASADTPMAGYFQTPVTVTGLAASDVLRALHSSRMRHDFIFSSDIQVHLHYVLPTTHIGTGRFWDALTLELGQFVENPNDFQSKAGLSWTLPVVLESIHKILHTIVGPEARRDIDDFFDVDLIMQELARGVANLGKLVSWLSVFLKVYCASVLDERIDTMLGSIMDGLREQDVAGLVGGIRSLVTILEAMVLDVVNHQVRRLKMFMIQSSVAYEQIYYVKLLSQGRLDLRQSYYWYKSYEAINIAPDFHDLGHMGVFLKGLLNCLRYTDPPMCLPGTLENDSWRFMRLRAQVLEAVNVNILVAYTASKTGGPEQTMEDLRSKRLILRRNILIILRPHQDAELASDGRPSSRAHPMFAVQKRWQETLPALAVEVWRSMSLPESALSKVESDLSQMVSNPHSNYFRHFQDHVINLLARLMEMALDEFDGLTNYDLHIEAAKSPTGFWDPELNPEDGNNMLLKNIARQATHLGIHHWNVWAPIAYADNFNIADYVDEDEEAFDDLEEDHSRIIQRLTESAIHVSQLGVSQLRPLDDVSDIGDLGLASTALIAEPALDVNDKNAKPELMQKIAQSPNSICGDDIGKLVDEPVNVDDSLMQE